jgi:hypothetical protein
MAEFTIRATNSLEESGCDGAQTSDGSWTVVYDGPVASRREAIDLADMLSIWWRRVQVIKRNAPGRIWLERRSGPLAV